MEEEEDFLDKLIRTQQQPKKRRRLVPSITNRSSSNDDFISQNVENILQYLEYQRAIRKPQQTKTTNRNKKRSNSF